MDSTIQRLKEIIQEKAKSNGLTEFQAKQIIAIVDKTIADGLPDDAWLKDKLGLIGRRGK